MIQLPIRRVVTIVNIVIAIAIAAALGVVYWFAWRPLPQRSGKIDAPVAAPVQVAFDARGMPHIRAANIDDALFTQGYVTAQDRLWQMEALRRYSAGDLSEVVGQAALESDEESRRLRIRRIAEDAYVTLPASDRTAIAAYVRGVNYFIATHLDNLPIEFTLLQFQPRPWSVVDTLIAGLYMFRDLSTTWRTDLLKHNMLGPDNAQKVNFLFPTRTIFDVQPGSNAWAVSGSLTASGKPLLSNDMHLEYSLPGIWYMMHLEAPGLDVAGVSLPGTPGVMVGHNRRIAWGITNLGFDVQDLYIEQFDERTGRYLYQGRVEQAREEREIIRVKGRNPVEMTVWVTRHGPIFVQDGGNRMSLRWAAAEPGLLRYPMLDIDRAQNWQEFTGVLAGFPGPGSNFVYADVDGNIGYHAAGKLPQRKGFTGDVPLDGPSGKFEWDGFIPFEQLPSVFNPPSGIIVSANQNPFPPNTTYTVHGNFASPDRARQIRSLLSARKGWRAGDMLTVQKDVYSAFDKFLAEQVIAVYDKRHAKDADLDKAIEILRKWDGQMDKDQAAPLIAQLIFHYVRTAVAENASPGNGAAYDPQISAAVVQALLRERPDGWFRDYDSMLLRAFVDALEEGKRMQGADVKRWRWGNYLNVTVENPIVHRIPYVGKYFDIVGTPMSGGPTTVKQTTAKLAPSMRMDVNLGDWDLSWLNILTGQSGQILSSHYKDQWLDWYYARSYPMEFGKVDAKNTLEFRPR
jgi:penicillin G amidase